MRENLRGTVLSQVSRRPEVTCCMTDCTCANCKEDANSRDGSRTGAGVTSAGEVAVNEYAVSVGDENILEANSDHRCPTWHLNLMPSNSTFE